MNPQRALAALLLLLGVSTAPAGATAATLTIDDPAFAGLFSSTSANPVLLSGSLPAFDPTLGTLTGVTLDTIGSGSAFLTLDAAAAGTYQGPLYVTTMLLDAGASILDTSGDSVIGTIRGTATGPGPVLLQDGNSWTSTIDITSGLGGFLSAGSYALEILFHGTVSGPGLLDEPYVADAFDGSILVDTVTFTYTPVPEPSTGLLVGLGLGLASAVRRART